MIEYEAVALNLTCWQIIVAFLQAGLGFVMYCPAILQ